MSVETEEEVKREEEEDIVEEEVDPDAKMKVKENTVGVLRRESKVIKRVVGGGGIA